MAYATISDVRALNPKRTYDSSSKPTSTQVEGHVDDIAASIDTVLRARGLSVPITTPTDFLNHLKLLNAQGAGALAEQAMFPEATGPGATPHGAMLWRQYQDGLKALRDGPLPVSLGGDEAARSLHTEHPVTEPVETYEWRKPRLGKDRQY